jgi:hypothetical protein
MRTSLPLVRWGYNPYLVFPKPLAKGKQGSKVPIFRKKNENVRKLSCFFVKILNYLEVWVENNHVQALS